MDQMEQQKRQAMAEFRRAESSKRALRALLSISFFFLLVSSSSWLPCLLHDADLHLSLFLNHLPDCFRVDRTTMFVLCNLILVVIAMDSGLLASFMAERGPCDDLPVRGKGRRSSEGDSSEFNSVASAGSTLQVLALEKDRGPEEEEEDEKEGGEEDGCPDLDELNKIFDDFIEKVKRNRKLEALQLVLA